MEYEESVEVWKCGSVEVWECGSVEVWKCGSVGTESYLKDNTIIDFTPILPYFHTSILAPRFLV